MNSADLDTTWLVLEEMDSAFSNITRHPTGHKSAFGSVEIAVRQSFREHPVL